MRNYLTPQGQQGVSRSIGNQYDRTAAYGGKQSGPSGQAHMHTTNPSGSQTAGSGQSQAYTNYLDNEVGQQKAMLRRETQQTNYLGELAGHMTNQNDLMQQQQMAAVNGSQAYHQGRSGQVNLADAYRQNALRTYAGSTPGGADLIRRAQALSGAPMGMSPAGLAMDQNSAGPNIAQLNASQKRAQDVATNEAALQRNYLAGEDLYTRENGDQVRMTPDGYAVVQRADGTQALTSRTNTSAPRYAGQRQINQEASSAERVKRLADPARQQRALEVFASYCRKLCMI